ncbi:MAG: molecular chaperone HtpG [Rickettsiales bacterium]|nr:molecular chaperone HtpG [Rickettsiales bacterium]
MSTTEKLKFSAEVDKLLHLMIHSIYTNKDIFLRELISNASDACDRLKYEATKNSEISYKSPLKIKIQADSQRRELIIEDNGIGMSKEELKDNLGSIAKSGTQNFIQKLSGESSKDLQMIGQFGVGFYSAFMVAEEVTVISKKVNTKEIWQWCSKGDGEFTLSIPETKLDSDHGTKIILKLKEDEQGYLEYVRIDNIIRTYSDHISVPIEFIEIKDGKEEVKVLNSSSALWTRNKSEIKEEAYNEFYKQVSLSPDTPWMILHNKSEGVVEYTNLLFIPSSKPFDLFHPDRKTRIKLYIRRVFINDEGIDMVPPYLRFLRGIVDSDDLPLNISRETLQHNKILAKVKQSIISRILSELGKKLTGDKDSYLKFWENFGAVFKEGLCEASTDQEKILNLCLFKSSKLGKLITLQEYVDNMQPGQDTIYYISGDNSDSLVNHPQLEKFKDKKIDVLLFTDHVDNFWVNVINKYKDTNLTSVTRANIDLDKINSEDKSNKDSQDKSSQISEEDKTKLVQYFKDVLKDVVKDVRISKKLSNSPVCLAVDEGSLDIKMEKFLIEQGQLKSSSMKVLEINPDHIIIQTILKGITENKTDKFTNNVAKMLFEQACIVEGEDINDSLGFSKRLNEIIIKAYS